jgi:hypothetical protein
MEPIRQAQRGQRDAREADSEFLQGPTTRDGFGHFFGQFIELAVHKFPFLVLSCSPTAGGTAVDVANEIAWVTTVVGPLTVTAKGFHFRVVRQAQRGERDTCEADAEFFSAPRRVTDWAIPLASSSNLLFITLPMIHVITGFFMLLPEIALRSCQKQPPAQHISQNDIQFGSSLHP